MEEVKQSAEERPHHPFSPSTLQYRESCSYYQPTNGDNEASKAGTRQHNAVDAALDDNLLSDDQAAAVADCLEFFQSLVRKYPGGTEIREQYLPIDDRTIHFRTWEGKLDNSLGTTAGYLDGAVVSADGKRAEIADWKFGQWAVEDAENNLQGMAYLLGLLVRFPDLEEVTVHFVMPHRDEHTYHTFKRSEFPTIYRRVRTVVDRSIHARTEHDFNKATPNLGACLFCANAGICDALAHIALKIGKKFAPLKIPENITPSLLKDPKQTGEGLRVASIVKAWAQAYSTQASAKALDEDDGFTPEGYILVRSQDREIKDPKKLREVCKEYLTDEEIDSASKFFITPLEALIRTRAPRGSKDATAEEFSEKLLAAGAIEYGPPKAFLRMEKKSEKPQTQNESK